MTTQDRYAGKDNYGRPKADYLADIATLDDDEFYRECYSMIYQSARCTNNLGADWHWMADACYDESKKRGGKSSIYGKAYMDCVRDNTQ